MKAILAAAVLLLGGAARADWQAPTPAEWALCGIAETSVALDLAITVQAMKQPGAYERNFLLGRNPSTEKTIALGGAGMLVSAALCYALPSPWRNVFSGGILAVEVFNDAGMLVAYGFHF